MPFYKCTTCGALQHKLRASDLPGLTPSWWVDCREFECEGKTEYDSESPIIKLTKGDTGG